MYYFCTAFRYELVPQFDTSFIYAVSYLITLSVTYCICLVPIYQHAFLKFVIGN